MKKINWIKVILYLMVFVPVILLNTVWLIANVILLRFYESRWSTIRFSLSLIVIILSVASLYPFIKLIFPILTQSEKDFLPKSYNFLFYFVIFLYNIFLILCPPFFIPFFVVFTVFTGFASVIEFRKGLKERNILKLIIPSLKIFGSLYFVYLFPRIVQAYTIVSYFLIALDFVLWYMFLKDHQLYSRGKQLYKHIKDFVGDRRFQKTIGIITVINLIFYLFSWPIYTEFWEELTILKPEIILMASKGSVEFSLYYQIMTVWVPIIGFIAFIMGMIFAIIYLILEKEQKKL